MKLRRRLRTSAIAVLMVFVAAACGGSAALQVNDAGTDVAADYAFLIPAGSGAAFDAGTPLEILPQLFEANVGETIEIVNEDDRLHSVGPWIVGAGETLRQTFVSSGEFFGLCTVHPSGEIRVVIS